MVFLHSRNVSHSFYSLLFCKYLLTNKSQYLLLSEYCLNFLSFLILSFLVFNPPPIGVSLFLSRSCWPLRVFHCSKTHVIHSNNNKEGGGEEDEEKRRKTLLMVFFFFFFMFSCFNCKTLWFALNTLAAWGILIATTYSREVGANMCQL